MSFPRRGRSKGSGLHCERHFLESQTGFLCVAFGERPVTFCYGRAFGDTKVTLWPYVHIPPDRTDTFGLLRNGRC